MAVVGGGGQVDEAVLAELRAIRQEIHDLVDKINSKADADDLDNYVRAETFAAHVKEHDSRVSSWRYWAPYVLSGLALAWNAIGPHIVLR